MDFSTSASSRLLVQVLQDSVCQRRSLPLVKRTVYELPQRSRWLYPCRDLDGVAQA